MSSDILDVSDADFDFQVLAYSEKKPVVVDFWAEWCDPCKMVTPILERLAGENEGIFRLAKVDVDQNPELTRRYQVQKLPNIKVFQHGRVSHEIKGEKTNQQIRDFIYQVVPGHENLLVEKAVSYLKRGEWPNAERASREFLGVRPAHPRGNLILAKSLLAQGKGAEAFQILKSFPTSQEFQHAEKLLPLARVLTHYQTKEHSGDPRLEAIFARVVRLISIGNLPSALDGLMDILRVEKDFHEGEARKMVIALFEMLGDDHPLTGTYRAELANILF